MIPLSLLWLDTEGHIFDTTKIPGRPGELPETMGMGVQLPFKDDFPWMGGAVGTVGRGLIPSP